MANSTPAGWYPPDPSKPQELRYWDGQQWTDQVPPEVAVAPPSGTGAARPWWKKKRFIIPGATLGLFIFLGAIGAANSGQPANVASSPNESSSQTPPAEPSEADSAETFVMPSLVGENLQAAQDQLQELGSYVLDQEDASGDGRLQVIDSNWQVCTQVPLAGEEVAIETIVVLASVKNDETCPGTPGGDETEPSPEGTTPDSDDDAMTRAQEQAVRSARNYLDYTAFSRSGLIDQLEFEGFSTKDATFGVDYLSVDWNEQAELKAVDYLDYTAFSRSGLIDQLEFEGFSNKQATFGVDQLSVDWNKQAALKAEEYLDYSSFSRSGLIDQLEFEGFTSSQARYGADAAGL